MITSCSSIARPLPDLPCNRQRINKKSTQLWLQFTLNGYHIYMVKNYIGSLIDDPLMKRLKLLLKGLFYRRIKPRFISADEDIWLVHSSKSYGCFVNIQYWFRPIYIFRSSSSYEQFSILNSTKNNLDYHAPVCLLLYLFLLVVHFQKSKRWWESGLDEGYNYPPLSYDYGYPDEIESYILLRLHVYCYQMKAEGFITFYQMYKTAWKLLEPVKELQT